MLDERITQLQRMRDQLDSCIGCGCLSLDSCGLYNPADRAASLGPGPRYLLGDAPAENDNGADVLRRPPRPVNDVMR
jgi:MerR family transcriptional regulator, redox-sensitive transcriptional activator SoxR